jgi:hypothetical protein
MPTGTVGDRAPCQVMALRHGPSRGVNKRRSDLAMTSPAPLLPLPPPQFQRHHQNHPNR